MPIKKFIQYFVEFRVIFNALVCQFYKANLNVEGGIEVIYLFSFLFLVTWQTLCKKGSLEGISMKFPLLVDFTLGNVGYAVSNYIKIWLKWQSAPPPKPSHLEDSDYVTGVRVDVLDSEAPNDFSTPQILPKQERENCDLSITVFANTTFTINGYLYWQCQCLMVQVLIMEVSQLEAINLATRFVQENKKEKENSTQKPLLCS